MHVNFLVCGKKTSGGNCLLVPHASYATGRGRGGLNNAKHDVGCEMVLEKLRVADGNNI